MSVTNADSSLSRVTDGGSGLVAGCGLDGALVGVLTGTIGSCEVPPEEIGEPLPETAVETDDGVGDETEHAVVPIHAMQVSMSFILNEPPIWFSLVIRSAQD